MNQFGVATTGSTLVQAGGDIVVRTGDHSVLRLHGPGGQGKTRLAFRSATDTPHGRVIGPDHRAHRLPASRATSRVPARRTHL